MKRTQEITKRLYIEELERPALAATDGITTLAVGEECEKCGGGGITTLAIGEECAKNG